jgi:hypothetical protein
LGASFLLPRALAAYGAGGAAPLRSLVLSLSEADAPAVEQLFGTPTLVAQLTRLCLGGVDVPPLLDAMPRRTELCMEDLEFRGATGDLSLSNARAIAAWRMPRLRRLAGVRCGARGALAALLAAPWAPELHQLEVAQWDGPALSGAPLRALATLRLGDTEAFPTWPEVARAPWFSALQALVVCDQVLATEVLSALASRDLPCLASLAVHDSSLMPEDLSDVLSSAPWLSQLTMLRLAHEADLGAPGLAALAGLPLPRLERLELRSVGVNDRALAALGKAPWLPQLTCLQVDEAVEDQGLYDCERVLARAPFSALALSGAIDVSALRAKFDLEVSEGGDGDE